MTYIIFKAMRMYAPTEEANGSLFALLIDYHYKT
jgi:hypothetical protein